MHLFIYLSTPFFLSVRSKNRNISFAETSDNKLAGNFLGRARTYGTFGTELFHIFISENMENTSVFPVIHYYPYNQTS